MGRAGCPRCSSWAAHCPAPLAALGSPHHLQWLQKLPPQERCSPGLLRTSPCSCSWVWLALIAPAITSGVTPTPHMPPHFLGCHTQRHLTKLRKNSHADKAVDRDCRFTRGLKSLLCSVMGGKRPADLYHMCCRGRKLSGCRLRNIPYAAGACRLLRAACRCCCCRLQPAHPASGRLSLTCPGCPHRCPSCCPRHSPGWCLQST